MAKVPDPTSHLEPMGLSLGEENIYYHRHLPHYHPPEATLFVTFRLKGSLPASVVEELRQEESIRLKRADSNASVEGTTSGDPKAIDEQFNRFDVFLDAGVYGPNWLGEDRVAKLVKEAIHFRDGKVYDLQAYCIMPNHVHLVFVGRNDIPTYRILQSLKRHTARMANRALGRTGAFWQDESYDHVVRDGEELERVLWYVLNNPVKAGLVSDWKAWPWSYCKPDLVEMEIGSPAGSNG
jgi:REP element-mobilizing transposase RayT